MSKLLQHTTEGDQTEGSGGNGKEESEVKYRECQKMHSDLKRSSNMKRSLAVFTVL